MSIATLDRLIDDFKALPLDDKEYALDVIKKQLAEAKRAAIAKRAKEATSNLNKGAVKTGTVKELYMELESD
jgi:ribosomal protein S1